MEPERLRRRLSSAFRLRGLLLRPDALKYLIEAFQSVSEGELDDVIENVIDAVEKQRLSSNMIEQPTVEAAVQECSRSPDETT
uniref:DNA polymerase epsilon subunit 2 n=1 Tax=Malurus cyaneus samueli TaxID=2593467 RepID=A0A8C5TPS1_9PASS